MISEFCCDLSQVYPFLLGNSLHDRQKRKLVYLSHTTVNKLSVRENYHQVCHIDRGKPQEGSECSNECLIDIITNGHHIHHKASEWANVSLQ